MPKRSPSEIYALAQTYDANSETEKLLELMESHWAEAGLEDQPEVKSFLIQLTTHDDKRVRELVGSIAVDTIWTEDEVERLMNTVLESEYVDLHALGSYLCRRSETVRVTTQRRNTMLTADEAIRLLNLQPHPVEGGFFRETYRSADTLPASALPRHHAERSVHTAIYYLLKPGTLSEMHVLPGDECFHFYLGSPVRMLQLWPDGSGKEVTLGSDLAAGHVPQLVVPGGVWQGSYVLESTGFALLGATMAPGFDYQDYVTGQRAELTAKWPAFTPQIAKLTPKG